MAEKRSYRYERKFLITELDEPQIRSILRHHRAMFFEVYPPRFVNNMYFDTLQLRNYDDNLIGTTERMKVRLRWYNELFGRIDQPILEFKLKDGSVGWKETYPIPPFIFDRGLSERKMKSLIKESDLPLEVKVRLAAYRMALVNRYWRSYFANPDGSFRVTLDTDLTFYKIGPLANRFLVRDASHGVVIVELKYNRQHELQADRISRSFPFRLTRSSKYVEGIERLLP